MTRSGYFIHPPWQAQNGGETFAEFPVSVPVGASLRFSVGVADNANCTDGVTFRVTIAGTELWRQHVSRTGWQDATLNLSSYGGTTVPIRLISHPGPANNSGCDWSLWNGLTMFTVPDGAPISIPLALSSGSVVSGYDGTGTYTPTGALTGTVNGFTVPGQFTLITQDGVSVANGTNLAALLLPDLDMGAWRPRPARRGSIRRSRRFDRHRRRHEEPDDLCGTARARSDPVLMARSPPQHDESPARIQCWTRRWCFHTRRRRVRRARQRHALLAVYEAVDRVDSRKPGSLTVERSERSHRSGH